MALSCFLKLSTATLRGQPLRTIYGHVLKTSPALSQTRQSHQILSALTRSGPLETKLSSLPINAVSVLPVRCAATAAADDKHKHHDHVAIWRLERVLSVLLLPLIPLALIVPCKPIDAVLAFVIVMHNHWGLEAMVVDYIRPILFGEAAPAIGMGLLYVVSIVTLAGLLNLTFNDVGIARAFLELWNPSPPKPKVDPKAKK